MTFFKISLMQRSFIFLIFALLLFTGCSTKNQSVLIFAEEDPKIQFAAEEIISALVEKGFNTNEVDREKADIILVVQPEKSDLKPELR